MLRLTIGLAACLLLPVPGRAAPPAPRKTRVAVMEIRALGTEAHKAELLSEVALTEASGLERFEIIGRSDIASMIGFEQQKKVLGCADDSSCLAEIGGALGVDQVLVGSLGRLGALYRVDLKLVDAKKARVLARFGESVEGNEEKLVATVQRGVRALLAPLLGGDPPPPVAARPRPGAVPLPPPPAGAAPAPAAGTTAPAAAGGGWTRRTWGWTLLGTGVGLAAVGAVFGIQAQSAYDAEKKASAAGDLDTYRQKRDAAKSNALMADVGFAAGGLSAGIGAYLLLTGSPARVAVGPTDGGLVAVYAGRF
ncbi:MAG: hypothetical protein HZB56_10450 [Deltaproteobacteria bacterium]|nr:hypothetical protein [Deltaproteobacteria bacterium]